MIALNAEGTVWQLHVFLCTGVNVRELQNARVEDFGP